MKEKRQITNLDVYIMVLLTLCLFLIIAVFQLGIGYNQLAGLYNTNCVIEPATVLPYIGG